MTTYVDVFTGDIVQPTDVSYQALSLVTNQTLTWPIPRILDVTGATGSTWLKLPAANLASVGQDTMINNFGANIFTVYASDGVTVVATVAVGASDYVYLTDNSTAIGTWKAVVMATSGSASTAAGLQGYGVRAISTAPTVLSGAITQSDWSTTTCTTALADRAGLINFTGSSGAALTLQNSNAETNYFFWFRNSGTATVTMTPSSGTVDGAASKVISPTESLGVTFNGTNWLTVGYGRAVTSTFTAMNVSLTGVSGTVALSSLSGYSAGATLVTFSGTPSGNTTVTFSTTANIWMLYNAATMSTYTLTVKTPLGSVSYVLSSGERTPFFVDGNDLLTAPSPTTVEAASFATALAVSLG